MSAETGVSAEEAIVSAVLSSLKAGEAGCARQPNCGFTGEVECTKTIRRRAPHRPTALITELLPGKRSKDDYIAFTGQLYFIYDALEAVAETLKTDAVATAFISPKLTRLPALEADLAFLVGDDRRESVTPLPATTRYVARRGHLDGRRLSQGVTGRENPAPPTVSLTEEIDRLRRS